MAASTGTGTAAGALDRFIEKGKTRDESEDGRARVEYEDRSADA